MLNKSNVRELAYLVYVDEVLPMNADRLECARVGGWNCVVGKDEFKKGDIAIYFEIDAKLPEVEPFTSMEFLASKHFKIKSQKIRGVVSQGLLVHPQTLGWPTICDETGAMWVVDKEGGIHAVEDESRFLTQKLGVTYAVIEDNARKASSADKYKKMAQRHPKLARKVWWRWLVRRKWGKKVLYALFGRKKDKKSEWPTWVVKTDEERVQNLNYNWLKEELYWIATEKVDGTSTTFTLHKRKFGKKRDFLVCSRNVVFDRPDKACFYDTNVYVEMAEKYDMEKVMNKMFDYWSKTARTCGKELEFVTIQAETYGYGIQKRDYNIKDCNRIAIFNIILGYKDGTLRLNPIEGKEFAERFGLHFVPVVDAHFVLPENCDELLEMASGESLIDHGMREGLVFRSYNGIKSFKAVSNEYLLKYHS